MDTLGGFERHKGRGIPYSSCHTEKFPASFVKHVMLSRREGAGGKICHVIIMTGIRPLWIPNHEPPDLVSLAPISA